MEYRNNFSAKTILQRVSVLFLMVCYGIVLATFLAELPLPEFTSDNFGNSEYKYWDISLPNVRYWDIYFCFPDCIAFACIIQKTGSKGASLNNLLIWNHGHRPGLDHLPQNLGPCPVLGYYLCKLILLEKFLFYTIFFLNSLQASSSPKSSAAAWSSLPGSCCS